MLLLNIENPFCAPVFFVESCESTMIESRRLLQLGAVNGTVIVSDYQSGGVGRTKNRQWASEAGLNLLFTVILRYTDFSQIPQLITLRAGHAVCSGIAKTEPQLKDFLRIKWPNDIMSGGKKLCGIASVCDGTNVFIGIGLNVAQKIFPSLPNATSICNELVQERKPCKEYAEYPYNRFVILQNILNSLHSEIKNDKDFMSSISSINEMLFLKDKNVIFMAGSSENPKRIEGVLRAVSNEGHIQIEEAQTGQILSFSSGELQITKRYEK
ncbi:MAG: hypothetical protein Ta2B_06650 [Termitinemataceae bacterium]|nr:MAG: hypothetical protein Ta2B_06650 [Termitinemataceae bacterium]